MHLIVETLYDYKFSSTLDEATGTKSHFIEGIFLESNKKNKNGRIYPKEVLSKEVNRYITESINTKRSIGELNHPAHPDPNPERASHLIVSLKESGDDYIGKAKVLNTPMGNIVKGLLDEGVMLGVSSRGLGSLRESQGAKVVQSDYYLSTVDIVSNPSAHSAFVNGLMEGKEWVWDNGVIKEQEIEKLVEKVNILVRPSEKDLCDLFESYMNILRNNLS